MMRRRAADLLLVLGLLFFGVPFVGWAIFAAVLAWAGLIKVLTSIIGGM